MCVFVWMCVRIRVKCCKQTTAKVVYKGFQLKIYVKNRVNFSCHILYLSTIWLFSKFFNYQINTMWYCLSKKGYTWSHILLAFSRIYFFSGYIAHLNLQLSVVCQCLDLSIFFLPLCLSIVLLPIVYLHVFLFVCHVSLSVCLYVAVCVWLSFC